MINLNQLKKDTLQKADRCVKCGLCSAQCPTYKLQGSENESPRGRVSLAQAIIHNQISDYSTLNQHINNCLTCQRCEKVCPSGVEFGKIMSNTRQLINEQQPATFQRSLTRWASQRTRKDWKKIAALTKLLQKTYVFALFPKLSPIRQHVNTHFIKHVPQDTQKKAAQSQDVYLFTGCTSHLFDAETIANARRLLTLCGFNVVIPEDQVCCGALPLHKGLLDSASLCQSKNTAIFFNPNKHEQAAIIFLATACGAALKNYNNESFCTQATNINTFLNKTPQFKSIAFTSSKTRILVHSPCSEKNALKEQGEVEALLSNLPGSKILSLEENTGCCGAAGDYMMTHAETANNIRLPLIKDILTAKPDVIVTSNYTCGMHIKNGLREINIDIPVMHPIKLLLSRIQKTA